VGIFLDIKKSGQQISPAQSLYRENVCNTLQQTATDCNTLQCTASHTAAPRDFFQKIDLEHNFSGANVVCVGKTPAAHFNKPQHTATHCNTMQHYSGKDLQQFLRRSRCNGRTPQHIATHCNTLQHTATTTKKKTWPTMSAS